MAARLIRAAFGGIRFLISTILGRLEGDESLVAEPGVPERISTGTSSARCSAIAHMIPAVELLSGG